MIIKNAIIEKVSLDTSDHGVLTSWLYLDYGDSSHQGFGGHVLYLPKNFKHHQAQTNYAGHWIFRAIQVAGVERWDQVVGRSIRVKCDKDGLGGSIIAIGHIVKDDWFDPKADFEKMNPIIE